MDESEEPTEGGKHTNTDVTNAFHIKTERNWEISLYPQSEDVRVKVVLNASAICHG